MTNEIIIDGKIYKLEGIWRCSKDDKSKDSKGNLYLYPKNENKWTSEIMQNMFLDRLIDIQNVLEHAKNKVIILPNKKCNDCLLCDKKKIITKRFVLGNYVWDDGLFHYIKYHNYKPNDNFKDKIFEYNIATYDQMRLIGNTIYYDDEKLKTKYIKLEKNQLMILDALMKHGGYNKKYYDTHNKNITRYSEHAGYLDIKQKNINNIIVSGNTLRVDRHDEEIFLPIINSEAFEYQYIFHTHPPTPKPGGRAKNGILYEFPSIGDIFHFIDHHNEGKTIGSLIMTPEGLYNIRKINQNKTKIKIDEDIFFSEFRKQTKTIQNDAINKYGTDFSSYYFYSTISQDTSYIKKINNFLHKYQLAIDLFPRSKDFKGTWIVNTIYIPIY